MVVRQTRVPAGPALTSLDFLFSIVYNKMATRQTHWYFEEVTPKKHPDVVQYREWVFRAIEDPIHTERQDDGKVRYYILVPEARRYMRVITLADGQTVFNAFFDRDFQPQESML